MGKKNGNKRGPSKIYRTDPRARDVELHLMTIPEGTFDISYDSNPHGVYTDYSKLKEILKKYGRQHFSTNHQHRKKEINIPSGGDFLFLLIGDDVKSERIAQYNTETRNIEGYFIIRKTKRTPNTGIKISELKNDSEYRNLIANPKLVYIFHEAGIYDHIMEYWTEISPETRQENMNMFAEKYKLSVRYLPARGFQYKPGVGFLEKDSESQKSLEQRLISIVAICGLSASVIFSSFNFTGNVVGSSGVTGFLGAACFVVGIVGSFLYFRRR